MNDFITIDFETAAYSRESAISIGLVKYHGYKPIASYYSLIRPPKLYIRPDFTAIHGLKTGDVKDAPDFKYIWKHELQGFFGSIPFAAHNAAFDMNVLYAALKHYDLPPPEKLKFFCSLALSRKVWLQLRSHSLTSLAEHFGISYDAHNALADAETCGKIIALCARGAGKSKGGRLPLITKVLERAGLEMSGA